VTEVHDLDRLPDDDDRGGGGDGDNDPADIQVPPSIPTTEPIGEDQGAMISFIESIIKLANTISSNRRDSAQTKLCKPDAFDSSNPKCNSFTLIILTVHQLE
jgi:hypothetical protein